MCRWKKQAASFVVVLGIATGTLAQDSNNATHVFLTGDIGGRAGRRSLVARGSRVSLRWVSGVNTFELVRGLTVLVSTILVVVTPVPAGAQQSEERDQEPRGFGGPTSIAGELERDNPPDFRVPIRYMRPWYEWKNRLTEDHGIAFNINYDALYASASDGYADAGSLRAVVAP